MSFLSFAHREREAIVAKVSCGPSFVRSGFDFLSSVMSGAGVAFMLASALFLR